MVFLYKKSYYFSRNFILNTYRKNFFKKNEKSIDKSYCMLYNINVNCSLTTP